MSKFYTPAPWRSELRFKTLSEACQMLSKETKGNSSVIRVFETDDSQPEICRPVTSYANGFSTALFDEPWRPTKKAFKGAFPLGRNF